MRIVPRRRFLYPRSTTSGSSFSSTTTAFVSPFSFFQVMRGVPRVIGSDVVLEDPSQNKRFRSFVCAQMLNLPRFAFQISVRVEDFARARSATKTGRTSPGIAPGKGARATSGREDEGRSHRILRSDDGRPPASAPIILSSYELCWSSLLKRLRHPFPISK